MNAMQLEFFNQAKMKSPRENHTVTQTMEIVEQIEKMTKKPLQDMNAGELIEVLGKCVFDTSGQFENVVRGINKYIDFLNEKDVPSKLPRAFRVSQNNISLLDTMRAKYIGSDEQFVEYMKRYDYSVGYGVVYPALCLIWNTGMRLSNTFDVKIGDVELREPVKGLMDGYLKSFKPEEVDAPYYLRRNPIEWQKMSNATHVGALARRPSTAWMNSAISYVITSSNKGTEQYTPLSIASAATYNLYWIANAGKKGEARYDDIREMLDIQTYQSLQRNAYYLSEYSRAFNR